MIESRLRLMVMIVVVIMAVFNLAAIGFAVDGDVEFGGSVVGFDGFDQLGLFQAEDG